MEIAILYLAVVSLISIMLTIYDKGVSTHFGKGLVFMGAPRRLCRHVCHHAEHPPQNQSQAVYAGTAVAVTAARRHCMVAVFSQRFIKACFTALGETGFCYTSRDLRGHTRHTMAASNSTALSTSAHAES